MNGTPGRQLQETLQPVEADDRMATCSIAMECGAIVFRFLTSIHPMTCCYWSKGGMPSLPPRSRCVQKKGDPPVLVQAASLKLFDGVPKPKRRLVQCRNTESPIGVKGQQRTLREEGKKPLALPPLPSTCGPTYQSLVQAVSIRQMHDRLR